MKTLDNKKVFVSTPETSKAVQEKAFKLGYRWDNSNQVKNTFAPFLFFFKNGLIGYTESFEIFTNPGGCFKEEITAAEILAMDIPEAEETFEVFQKVLVRDEDNEEWEPDIFTAKTDLAFPFRTLSSKYKQCIDYKKNKHLAFTTDKP